MSETNDGAALPTDLQQLGELIAQFDASTAKLQASHDDLQARVALLTGQLQKKNDELSRTLDEVSALKNSLASILSSITDGVIAIGLDRRIVAANATAAATLPGPCQLAEGTPLADALPGEAAQLGEILGRALAQREPITNREITFAVGPEETHTVTASASPIRDDEGAVIGAVETFRDLTEIKALERRAARQERLAALGEMAAGVAHEIRNPLGGIELYAGVIKRNVESESKAAEMSDKIMAAAASLNRIVTDMLTFTRAREPVRREVPVEHILHNAIELAAAPLQEKEIALHYNFTTDNRPVRLDDELLARAFLNVILNAVEAMAPGQQLSLQTDFAEDDTGPVLQVRILDEGPGIPPSARDKLFNPFFTLRKDGTGLGLAITHKIVRDHGGQIAIEDVTPRGTAFILTLPVV